MSKVKPILFSAPMVRALLEGRKTQTRRVLKTTKRDAECLVWLDYPEGREFYNGCADGSHVWPDGNEYPISMPYAPGDLLWVRETWRLTHVGGGRGGNTLPFNSYEMKRRATEQDVDAFTFEGDDDPFLRVAGDDWRPSIFMPRWASRLTLAVTGVKVERLQDISAADALAEGIYEQELGWNIAPPHRPLDDGYCDPRDCYADLWESINGPGSWDANTWIVAVTFTVHKINVDAYLAQQRDAA